MCKNNKRCVSAQVVVKLSQKKSEGKPWQSWKSAALHRMTRANLTTKFLSLNYDILFFFHFPQFYFFFIMRRKIHNYLILAALCASYGHIVCDMQESYLSYAHSYEPRRHSLWDMQSHTNTHSDTYICVDPNPKADA